MKPDRDRSRRRDKTDPLPPDDDDDIALLECWAAGDPSAGQRLFARHFASVYSFFDNKCPAETDELVQSTFLECLRAKDAFRKESSFRTYLFTIARHQLYRMIESRQRDDRRIDVSVSSMAQLMTTPRTKLAANEEQRLLLLALRELPVTQQTLLELHYFEDLGFAELAQIFDATEGAIRVRLHRARKALRERMERQLPLEVTESTLDAWARRVLETKQA